MSQPHLYDGFGLTISSEIELPGMRAGFGTPDIVIRVGRVPEWHPSDAVNPVRTERGNSPELGRFLISGGREIVVELLPGADPRALRMVLLGRVMACLLRQRGWVPLHASAVRVEGRAILFLGDSGAGKSTTAAAFIPAGHAAIADDIAPVRTAGEGHCVMSPVWARLRLLEDAVGVLGEAGGSGEKEPDKHTFALPAASEREPLPVARIYLLEYGDELRAERLRPALAVTGMTRFMALQHVSIDHEALKLQLRECAGIASSGIVRRLTRPAAIGLLPDLVRFVEREAQD